MSAGTDRARAYRERHRAEVNLRAMLAERRKRAVRQAKAGLRRPRCMICDEPIQYGKTGVRYSTTTCGKPVCQMKRYRWFVAA